MNTIDSLLDKIEKAKALDFGTIFSESIELFKKVWVQGLVMLLLTMLLMVPFYIIMYLPMLAMGLIDPQSFQNMENMGDFTPLLMLPFFIFMLLFVFIAMVIGFGLKASFYRICKLKDLEEMGADDYFYYLKKPYLGKVMKLSLASFGIWIAAMLLCVLPIFYVMVPLAVMNVVFAFNPELSTSEIIKASFKLGNKKWLLIFGLTLVSGFLAGIVGMLMCCIGIYVTSAFAYLPVYYVYKESVGFNKETDKKQDNEGYGMSYE
ncbi:hypothetical protein EV196_10582 [Mariniflexile fucanivorans]|uniref:Glycerophosphoryl diester phosphodiesterase family protein n=1 Tax=Mariniflexile fucanivorans TaxID=264023 RepID=A0A4R1RH84_9FLAO|nr:hypothetical protein [Mariniflexile fucanivorans]TCL65425.1 hypothetical protein EV196_10582 [Mariniflexile fucanivorans]